MIAAGPRFGIDGVFERFIRIPFSHPADLIDGAVDALAAAWRDVARTPMPVGDEDLRQRRSSGARSFHPAGVRCVGSPLGYWSRVHSGVHPPSPPRSTPCTCCPSSACATAR